MNKKEQKVKFTQDASGLHGIRDAAGNEISIDASKLTMEDIRELLSGFGNIMQSIASQTWNKELTEIDSTK
jgi:hypothetical protein